MIKLDGGDDAIALESMVLTLLDSKKVQEAGVAEQVDSIGSQWFPTVSSDSRGRISMRLLERLSIELELGVAVKASDFAEWLRDRKPHVEWKRWTAYRTLLKKQGRPLKVLDRLGEATDTILELTGNPNAPGSWQRRGLVIGEVQSGKTSTYIGLLNKAADAGYRIFIVIGGHTESLRAQTQTRVDEGFVGRDSLFMSRELRHLVEKKLVGVGTIDPSIRAYGFTTVEKDFSVKTADALNFEVSHDISEPVILVVKKNTRILENLHGWLHDQAPEGGRRMPILVLDDEADYASINTRDEDNATAVNTAIRKLLKLSTRSSYVGFTATPFANVLIDHVNEEDLFPKDFIYSLESPSNYVGADATFGEETTPATVFDLTDVESYLPLGHPSSLQVSELPESLITAVASFIVANAIRDIRGDSESPRSMLINVSRYNNVQKQVHDLVEELLAQFRNTIEFDDQSIPSELFEILERVHLEHFGETGLSWAQIQDALPGAVESMTAVLVNSRVNSAAAFTSLAGIGRSRIIATGGTVLSRGLTLNGLMTSYFYQKSRASDTLMQMGRWFGYRDGYRDLCRLWIDREVATWYSFVAESVRELREDLRQMNALGMTPTDFGLKVRKHPDSLLVTAANKSRFAETVERTISLRDKTLESSKITVSASLANYSATHALLKTADRFRQISENVNAVTFRGVPKELIADFLDRFRSSKGDAFFGGSRNKTASSFFADYVRTATDGDLSVWDVVVVGGGHDLTETVAGTDIRRVGRKLEIKGVDVLISGERRRVAGPSDLGLPLTLQHKNELAQQAKQAGRRISERDYRSKLLSPTLMLYFIEPSASTPESVTRGLVEGVPIVAVKVAFPADPTGFTNDVRNTKGVRYLINTVLKKDWLPEVYMDLSDDDMLQMDDSDE